MCQRRCRDDGIEIAWGRRLNKISNRIKESLRLCGREREEEEGSVFDVGVDVVALRALNCGLDGCGECSNEISQKDVCC